MIIGWIVRNKSVPSRSVTKATLWVICVLMLLIGVEIGGSRSVLNSLGSLLSDALLLTIGAVGGTILLAMAVNVFIVRSKASPRGGHGARSPHTFSFVVVVVFVVGVILGYSNVVSSDVACYSVWVLYVLMALVGFSIGSDVATLRALRSQQWRVIFVPAATIVGTLLGVILISPLINHTLTDQLAVGSGFGYYSLSSVLLGEIRGAELGALALLVNVLRELVTVIFAPFLVKVGSPVALICSGGATTIDVTLPVIVNNCGGSFVGMAIFHGVVVDMSVPLLVTFFASMT